jgi:hypothetical protein
LLEHEKKTLFSLSPRFLFFPHFPSLNKNSFSERIFGQISYPMVLFSIIQVKQNVIYGRVDGRSIAVGGRIKELALGHNCKVDGIIWTPLLFLSLYVFSVRCLFWVYF